MVKFGGSKIQLAIVGTLLVLGCSSTCWSSEQDRFSFHLASEPHTVDPLKADAETLSYLSYNLWRGLLSLSPTGEVVPGAASGCIWKTSQKLICELRKGHKWSDGKPVTAQEFVETFREVMNSKNASRERSLLASLENYDAILKGEAPPARIGVKASSSSSIEFSLARPDGDFREKLTYAGFAPRRPGWDFATPEALAFNGPYQIKTWVAGSRIVLKPNPEWSGSSARSKSEVFIRFLPEEATALTLFDKGDLDFVRRVPASQIMARKSDPGFFQVPLSRFDYIGFGPTAVASLNFRKALAHAVNYSEFSKVFDALGRPGCPSSPESWTKKIICYDFDMTKAREAWALVPNGLKTTRHTLFISAAGGEDLRRVAEWYREQWKRQLTLEVDIQSLDFGVLTEELRRRPPTLFRRGVPLDRPTCLAALESFTTNHADNFIRFSDSVFDKLVDQLKIERTNAGRVGACTHAMERLMSSYVMIPQGRIHFSFLRNTKWTGIAINELGYFDLAKLQMAPR